jgi:ferredoxin
MPVVIRIDRELCIGAQNCVRRAPTVFAIDDEGLACLLVGDAEPALAEVLEAAHDCPTGAIAVTGDGTPLA